MPYQSHKRVRLNGEIGPRGRAVERFSYGFSINNSALVNENEAALVAACVAYHERAETAIHTEARLTELALHTIGEDGRQIGDTIRFGMDVAGGGGTNNEFPPQVAYRVSTGTGSRGRSNKGGWYVPCPVLAILRPAWDMGEGQANQVLGSAVILINALQAIGDGHATPVIASSIVGNSPITQLRVGRAFDTIRSRRRDLVEAYAVADV